MSNEENPLQPPSVSDLPDLYQTGITAESNNELLDKALPFMNLLWNGIEPTAVDARKSEYGIKTRDQITRAKTLAQKFRIHHHRTVRLMDGHGRFLIRFMYEFRKLHGIKALNALEIELIDIDEAVTSWHKVAYSCPNVKCLTEDIIPSRPTDRFERASGPGAGRGRPFKPVIEQVQVPETTLLYMNFCGLGSSVDAVKRYARDATNSFLLSFSLQRGAAGRDADFSRMVMSKGMRIKLAFPGANRGDFVTFIIERKPKGEEEEESAEDRWTNLLYKSSRTELKELCRQRGLSTSGRKMDLIERLRE